MSWRMGWLWLLAALSVSGQVQAQTTVEYIHTDALGSVVAVTDAAGQVIERNDYEPYGAVIGQPNFGGVGFTGHVQDAVTGLTYMQQRYYDPMIGRFLSVDPVTADENTGDNFNRYKYAANNPYGFIDPDGRQETSCTGSRVSCPSATQGAPQNEPAARTSGTPGKNSKAESSASSSHTTASTSHSASTSSSTVEPLYCTGGAECDFMYNQQEFIAGRLSEDAFIDRTVAQGKGGMIGAAAGLGIASGPEGWAVMRSIYHFIRLGREISFGKDIRIAPFGNRTGHPYGRWPHYHRRGKDASGQTRPGQGIGRHRPGEKNRQTDLSGIASNETTYFSYRLRRYIRVLVSWGS